jgi:phosphoenolpyruvate carboxylase
LLYQLLQRTEVRAGKPWRADHRHDPRTYASADDFVADLELLRDSLRSVGAHLIADGRLRALQIQAEVFGFHLVTLDLRQHADRHREALAAVFRRYGDTDDWAGLDEEDKVARLTHELTLARPLTPAVLDFDERDQRDLRALPARAPRLRPARARRHRHLHHLDDRARLGRARRARDGATPAAPTGSTSCRCSRPSTTSSGRRGSSRPC